MVSVSRAVNRRSSKSIEAIVAASAESARSRLSMGPRISSSHLERAIAALAVAEAADRLAREAIMVARDQDGVTWEEVGEALGISRQTAHERFRTGPDGMHSRYFKKKSAQPTGKTSGSGTSAKGRSGSAARRRDSTARS